MLSKACEYAIRTALHLATSEVSGRPYIPVHEIAHDLAIPFHFLSKVTRTLSRSGILTSARGAKGGIGLARPARAIPLSDIIAAVDGVDSLSGCILGLPQCDEDNPCALHELWKKRRQQIEGMFDQTTLLSLARSINGSRHAAKPQRQRRS